MKQNTMIRQLPKLTLRAKILSVVFALAAAVALPQILHVAGRALGVGTALGEIWLPMHLPILLVGLLAGPAVGGLAGVFAPMLSFLLSGMPVVAALPFMCIELCAYGFCTGALRSMRVPVAVKLLAAQLLGRGVRTLAILLASVGGHTALTAGSVWTAVKAGLPGLALQWILIPLAVWVIEKLQANEK